MALAPLVEEDLPKGLPFPVRQEARLPFQNILQPHLKTFLGFLNMGFTSKPPLPILPSVGLGLRCVEQKTGQDEKIGGYTPSLSALNLTVSRQDKHSHYYAH